MAEIRKTIDIQAIFSDESERFRVPAEPVAGGKVTIRIRTAKDNVDTVILHKRTRENGAVHPGQDLIMKKVFKNESVDHNDELMEDEEPKRHYDSQFDYYELRLPVGDEPFWYYFLLSKDGAGVCYNQRGAGTNADPRYDFVVRPGVHVPDWAKGSVMYQIFTDRFCNGDPSNDVLDREYLYVQNIPSARVKNWNEDLLSLDVGRFYGGDLQGVLDKLDYIQELGVEVIYFNPLFVSPSNHKYDIQDYDYIDPHFGVIIEDEGDLLPEGALDNRDASRYICRVTSFKNLEASNALFEKLCKEIHARGMRVIIDGVFNHCGSFNKWLDREHIYDGREGYEKGAYVSEDSPYHNYFIFEKEDWPDNKHYNGWWDNNTLPKLNYEESEELCEYILRVGQKWVSEPYCVDGWRLDVAADLGQTLEFNHKFWKRFRKKVKEINPECLILAEHYGDCYDWLQGDEWDTIMNYDAFMDPVTWFLTGLEKHSDRYDDHMFNNGYVFHETMMENMCRFHYGALLSAMNELSNHDHSRFMTKTNRHAGRIAFKGSRAAEEDTNRGIYMEGYMMQMTWPGAPTIYYGDETAMCGWTDPDSRRPYPWNNLDHEMIEFYKYMGGIHRVNPALRKGSFKFLRYDYGLLMYGRFVEDNRMAVVINNNDRSMDVDIPVWQLGIENGAEMRRIMSTSAKGYNVGPIYYMVKGGKIRVHVHAYGSLLVRTIRDGEWVDPASLEV